MWLSHICTCWAKILWGSAAGDRQGVLLGFKPVVPRTWFSTGGESCNSSFFWLERWGRMGSRMPRIEVCGCWCLSPNPPLQHLLLWTMPWLAPLGDTAMSKRRIQSCEKYAYSCFCSFFVWQVLQDYYFSMYFHVHQTVTNSGYLSWIRSLACCAPYHWNWIAPLPQKTFNGTFFFRWTLCRAKSINAQVLRGAQAILRVGEELPLGRPEKNRHPDMSPPKRLPWCLRRMESASAGRSLWGVLWLEVCEGWWFTITVTCSKL